MSTCVSSVRGALVAAGAIGEPAVPTNAASRRERSECSSTRELIARDERWFNPTAPRHRPRRADEIAAHETLVGEARLGLAPARGAREVFADEALPVLRRGVRYPERERRIARSGFRVDHFGHVLDLVSTLNLWMRSED